MASTDSQIARTLNTIRRNIRASDEYQLPNRIAAGIDAAKAGMHPVEAIDSVLLHRMIIHNYLQLHNIGPYQDSDAPQVKVAPVVMPPMCFKFVIGNKEMKGSYKFNSVGSQKLEVQAIQNDIITMVLSNEDSGVQRGVPSKGQWNMIVSDTNDVNILSQAGLYDLSHDDQRNYSEFVHRIRLFDSNQMMQTQEALVGVSEVIMNAVYMPNNMILIKTITLALFMNPGPEHFAATQGTTAIVPSIDLVSPFLPASFVTTPTMLVERPSASPTQQSPDLTLMMPTPVERPSASPTQKPATLTAPNVTLMSPTVQPRAATAEDGHVHVFIISRGGNSTTLPWAYAERRMTGANIGTLLFGSNSPHKTTFAVSNARGAMVYHEGDKDNLVSLGHATVQLSMIGLTRYYLDNNGGGGGGGDSKPLNLKDPENTKRFLDQAGNGHVYGALKKCYSRIGNGDVPSLHELMSGTSGLPMELSANNKHIHAMLSSRNNNNDTASSDPVEDQCNPYYIASALEQRVVPLFSPGAANSESRVAYALLRYTVKGDAEKVVEQNLHELGLTSATFNPPSLDNDSKSIGNSGSNDNEEADIYALARGLYASPAQLAQFMSGKNQWYAMLNKSAAAANKQLANRYGFMTHMLQPQFVVDDTNQIYESAGMTHIGVNYNDHQIRALVKLGNVMGEHTCINLMVPALHIGANFSTTAAPEELLNVYNNSTDALYKHLVGYALDTLEGKDLLYDPAAEHLVAFSPSPSKTFHDTCSYERNAVQRTFKPAQINSVVGSTFLNNKMVPLLSSETGINTIDTKVAAQEGVTLTTKPAQQVYGPDAPADEVALLLQHTNLVGAKYELPVVLDKNAPNTLQNSATKLGALRTLNPANPFAGEYVMPSVVKIAVAPTSTATQNNNVRIYPVLSYCGVMYGTPETLAIIAIGNTVDTAKHISTELARQDALAIDFATRARYDPHKSTLSSDIGSGLYSGLLATNNSASDVQKVGQHRGWSGHNRFGSRGHHRSGYHRSGRGLGLGLGLGAGLGTLLGSVFMRPSDWWYRRYPPPHYYPQYPPYPQYYPPYYPPY